MKIADTTAFAGAIFTFILFIISLVSAFHPKLRREIRYDRIDAKVSFVSQILLCIYLLVFSVICFLSAFGINRFAHIYINILVACFSLGFASFLRDAYISHIENQKNDRKPPK
jgi:hypothetical protein